MAHVLVQVDNKAVPPAGEEIRLFCVVRDERARVPHLVRHYRKLGVDRLFFIDNGSSDGTLEWLLQQPDCHVYSTTNSYTEADYGTDWANALIQRFGLGHWCFLVDADELFVFDGYEERGIKEFAAGLEGEGAEGVFAFMLDMYPAGALERAQLSDEVDIVAVAPLFDSDYVFQRPPARPGKSPPFPGLRVLGGPRQRFAGDLGRVARQGWVRARVHHSAERLLHKAPSSLRQRLVRFLWSSPPVMQKIPFVKVGKGFRFHAGAHRTTPIRLAETSAVLLHFKFLADFHDRVLRAIEEGEHYLGGAQYMWYRDKILRSGSGSLVYEGSRSFSGSESLRDAGFFRELKKI